MIAAAHTIPCAHGADAARALFRGAFELGSVDAGHGSLMCEPRHASPHAGLG
jgi:L-aminopeptidase/D-esterase-like protein